MELKDYMKSLTVEEREAFAAEAGTSVGYINLLSCGARKASHGLARKLETASKYQVTKEELRPDIFGQKAA